MLDGNNFVVFFKWGWGFDDMCLGLLILFYNEYNECMEMIC